MTIHSHTQFKKGDKVEVTKQENGPNTLTYYPATVLRSPAKFKSKTASKTTQILIQYETLKESTKAHKPITEFVDVGSVRPMPPRLLLNGCFRNGDGVDVFCDNGWQKGTVKDVLENENYVVGFDGKSEGIVAEHCNLRLHRDWDWLESSWVPLLLEHETVLPAMDEKPKKARLLIRCSESEPVLSIGAKVEVKTDEEGYPGAWFGATIVGTIGNDKFLVQYMNLLTDDESAPLREIIYAKHIRPFPPPIPSDAGFKQFEKVDVWFNEMWWEGEVSGVLPGSRYIVYFKFTNESLEYDHSALRHHQEWIEGKWVQEKSKDLDANELILDAQFGKGTKVEVKSDEVGFQGAWFAATIINVIENGNFEVQYDSILTDDGNDFLKEQANASDIRPLPPDIQHVHPYRLFETVDAWFNDAWWVGRVVKVYNNSKYKVDFKTTEELEFAHSELRPHQEWADGHWVIAKMDWGCDS
ncbi:protein AGENET DOMAIN (AGD)-CONTAINING P1 [Mercurialis annua]|uniref:protein AGENET DOMAIN (AGD)-CONTAINING P1 n=1 Tax=Mercurialis annua TaxID=3986 RepID=UPI00215FA1FF|nr:protein AGENET DOMAIN (AGD)-CONTAINING P1 [Mercurialis annua]